MIFFSVVIKFVSKVMRYTGQGKRHDHVSNEIEERMCQHQVAGLPFDGDLLCVVTMQLRTQFMKLRVWAIQLHSFLIIIIIIIIIIHGLSRLTCAGIDALPSFPGASAIPSAGFVSEGVIRESGVVHCFEVVDPVLFVFESHVLYSRDL